MMNKEWQVVIAGEGGQGQLFIASLLGGAALEEGKNVAQTASYGISSRGGFTKAEVVISPSEIWYPAVIEPNVILALSSEAVDKYLPDLSSDCLLIYDADKHEQSITSKNVKGFSLTTTAKKLAEETGQRVMVNVIGLGAILGLTKIVAWESLEKVIKAKFPSADIVNSNLDALRSGMACCDD